MKNKIYQISILLVLSACAAPILITKKNVELNKIVVNDKVGFIDQKGKIRIEPEYQNCKTEYFYQNSNCPYNDYFANKVIVIIDGRYGVVNWKNEVVIEPKYDYLEDEYDGNYLAKIDSLYGIINSNDKLLIPFIFKKQYFLSSDSFVPTFYQNGTAIYNSLDTSILELPYDYIGPFFNGYAEVTLNKKKGLIDNRGKLFLTLDYDEIEHHKDGPIAVKQGDNWFFLTYTKEKFLDSTYSIAFQFEGGYAVVKKEKYGVIDEKGNTVIPFEYEFLRNEGEGVFMFSNIEHYFKDKSLQGLINIKNEVILEPKFNSLYPYAGATLALANDTLTGLTGIINIKNAKVIIPFQFLNAEYYIDGLSKLQFSDKDGNLFFGYINRYKKIIWSNNVPLLKEKLDK